MSRGLRVRSDHQGHFCHIPPPTFLFLKFHLFLNNITKMKMLSLYIRLFPLLTPFLPSPGQVICSYVWVVHILERWKVTTKLSIEQLNYINKKVEIDKLEILCGQMPFLTTHAYKSSKWTLYDVNYGANYIVIFESKMRLRLGLWSLVFRGCIVYLINGEVIKQYKY